MLLLVFAELWCQASAQPPRTVAPSVSSQLDTEEIVQKLVATDLERSEALHAYQVSEVYSLAYRGFLGTGTASMLVSVKYRSPGTTTLIIESSSGSKLILNKVFKKLLQAERQVLGVEAQRKAALNRSNYDFELTGQQKTPSGLAYVLRIKSQEEGYVSLSWPNLGGYERLCRRSVRGRAREESFVLDQSQRNRTNIPEGRRFLVTIEQYKYYDSPVWRSCRHGDSVQQLPDHQRGAASGIRSRALVPAAKPGNRKAETPISVTCWWWTASATG
jgi:hypothetical protein